jgi:2-polyprenyl-6-methoxyphenol hydroxylase-like FAD-dependent oxidoreductase
MERLRILVVGAGLAGLAVARALRRGGLEAEVVERVGRWEVAGTGIYLPANGVRALRGLGLEGSAAGRGARIGRQRVLDRRGRVLVDVDLDRFWRRVGPCLALHRADLHAVLREGVAVRMGTGVRALERVDGPVEVAFDDGRQGRYDLVVGADGLRSTVRPLAVDDRPPTPVGQHSWRFVTACPPETTAWSLVLAARSSFLTIPIGQGRAYCYADVLAGRAGRRRALGPRGGRAGRRRRPRHVPQHGPGAALAFEDALVLAGALRESGSVAEALAGFVARRQPRASWVRARTHRRDRTRRLPPPVRDPFPRAFGERIFRSNYRPLLAPP